MANDFAPANRLWFKLKPIYSELAKGLCLVQIGLYFMFSQMANALAVQICPLNKIAVIESREWNRRSLKVVQTDHRKRPIVVGTVQTKNQSYALNELVAYENYVVAQFWNELEIYDVSDRHNPRLVRLLNLKETHSPWGGGDTDGK